MSSSHFRPTRTAAVTFKLRSRSAVLARMSRCPTSSPNSSRRSKAAATSGDSPDRSRSSSAATLRRWKLRDEWMPDLAKAVHAWRAGARFAEFGFGPVPGILDAQMLTIVVRTREECDMFGSPPVVVRYEIVVAPVQLGEHGAGGPPFTDGQLEALEAWRRTRYERTRFLARSLQGVEADDLLQDVMQNVLLYPATYQRLPEEERQAYLDSCLKRAAYDRARRAGARKRGREGQFPQLGNDGAATFEPRDETTPSPELRAVEAEFHDFILHATPKLKKYEREVIERIYFDGWTEREFAERLGVPLGTVKTRKRMALQRISQEAKPFRDDHRG